MPKIVTAADIMKTKLVTFTPETNVMVAIKALLNYKISGAPVIDSMGKLVGILSEVDCVNHFCQVLMESLPLLEVGQLMTPIVKSVSPTTTLPTLADAFTTLRVRRIPVVDGEHRLLGQISRRDLLQALHDMMDTRQQGGQKTLYLSAVHDVIPSKISKG